jgi:hypothetical protein
MPQMNPVYLMCRAGSQQGEYISYAVVVLIDTVMLRYQRQAQQLETLAAENSTSVVRRRSSAKEKEVEKDTVAAMKIDLTAMNMKLETEESLLFDKRALRLENSVSSYQIFIPGIRYIGRWVLSLKKSRPSDHTTPCLCAVAPMGLVVLLPTQRLMVPLFWREISECKSKKERLVFIHTYKMPVAGKEVVDYWTFIMPRAQQFERAMLSMVESAATFQSKPLPKM